MKSNGAWMAVLVAWFAVSTGWAAEPTVGAVVGLVTDAAHLPVARATVTAVRADGTAVRATLTGPDGVYSLPDLPSGDWTITIEMPGAPRAVANLMVTAGRATRSDLVLNAPAGAAPAPAPTAPVTRPQLAAAANVPEALQAPEPAPAVDTQTPFAVGDIGWMNGNSRTSTPIFDTKFFTPEIRFDGNYLQDFNHPVDHTIVGSTEEFRSGEFQVEQFSVGGNFHWHDVQARFLTMFGL